MRRPGEEIGEEAHIVRVVGDRQEVERATAIVLERWHEQRDLGRELQVEQGADSTLHLHEARGDRAADG